MTVPDVPDDVLEGRLTAQRPLHWEHSLQLLRRAQIAEAALQILCDECPYKLKYDRQLERIAGAPLDEDAVS